MDDADDPASRFLTAAIGEGNDLNFVRYCERKLNHTDSNRVNITPCVEKLRLAYGIILKPFLEAVAYRPGEPS